MNQRRALELALEALENSIDTVRNEYESDWRHGMPTRQAQLDSMKQMLDQHESAIAAIREALAQPEQEPAGTVRTMVEGRDFSIKPKREWVGLTEEEKRQLNDALNLQGRFPIIAAIEAKLREKNT